MINIPLDKQGHFLAGYAIMATLFNISFVLGIVTVLVVAGIKEWYDFKHPLLHTADIYDFIATTLGGATALLLMTVIYDYFR